MGVSESYNNLHFKFSNPHFLFLPYPSGLSTVAMCAPSEKFLNMGGPLAIGLGVVFASSIGGMFLPPTTALGAGLYSISMYGGLVLFGMFLLYDTQRIIKHAETHPVGYVKPFDPVNQ